MQDPGIWLWYKMRLHHCRTGGNQQSLDWNEDEDLLPVEQPRAVHDDRIEALHRLACTRCSPHG